MCLCTFDAQIIIVIFSVIHIYFSESAFISHDYFYRFSLNIKFMYENIFWGM